MPYTIHPHWLYKRMDVDLYPTTIPNATESSDGLMSAADKAKLDSLPGGGENGHATFNSTQDYIDVTLTTPYASESDYNINSLTVRVTDSGPGVSAWISGASGSGFRINVGTRFNGRIDWSVVDS